MLNRLYLFIAAVCLGSVLARLHIPIPFLLGGLLAAVLCKTFLPDARVSWPKEWRQYGLAVAGYGLGASFTTSAWNNFLSEIIGVTEATVVILSTSFVLAYIASRLSTENAKTCMIGMMPGGITLSMLIAEEDKEINANVVMVMQVIRMMSVVVSVPFLVVWLLNAHVVGSSIVMTGRGGLHWIVFAPLCVIGCIVATRLHFPTPKLLGPILLTALVSIYMDGVQPVPFWIMIPAQISIGLFMGMQLDPRKIVATRHMIPLILIGTAVLILVSIGMANLLSTRYGFSLITAFLAMAPGGITEMSLAGMSMNEDVSVILAYQLVRVLGINIFIPPIFAWWFKTRSTRTAARN